MSVTIKDIARIANVAHSTVSRALNDSPSISDETKGKIRAIAKELGYAPNVSARSLVLDRSYNIGLFFTTMDKGTAVSFFYDVVSNVNKIIRDEYNLIVRGIDDYKSFNLISKKNFDGIIVMSQSDQDNDFISAVWEKNIPLVVLNREIDWLPVTNLFINDRKGAFHAVQYLIKKGHKKIGIIEGKKGFKSTQKRKQGYLDALKNNNLPCEEKYIVKGDYSTESGYNCMIKLLKLQDRPDAVFCSNDEMAMGAINAAHEKGLHIPEHISIMGFDDSIFAAYLTPRLTTIRRPVNEMSQKGTESLLRLIENKSHDGERCFMDAIIIERQSVSSIKSQ